MQYPLTADLSGVLAIAHREQPVLAQRSHVPVGASLPIKVWRATTEAWAQHIARRVEAGIAKLDRAGLLDDDKRVARRSGLGTGPHAVETPLDSTAPIR